jgi:hypothetical protein
MVLTPIILIYIHISFIHINNKLLQKIKLYFFPNIRITAAIKVETDITASITASLIGGAVILIIVYVEIFTLTHNIQYQNQFVDT